jgi:hypothetical protein
VWFRKYLSGLGSVQDVGVSSIRYTSLKESETPGNLDDCIVVTPSGLGGNDAANAVSAKEHAATEIFSVNMAANSIRWNTIAMNNAL